MAITFWRKDTQGAKGTNLEAYCKEITETKGDITNIKVVQSEYVKLASSPIPADRLSYGTVIAIIYSPNCVIKN